PFIVYVLPGKSACNTSKREGAMSEHEIPRWQRLAYEKMLYNYTRAYERGDLDLILSILKVAENDPRLEQMIIEVHQQGYQRETSMPGDTNYYQQAGQPPRYNVQTPLPPRETTPSKKRKSPVFRVLAAALVGIILIGSAIYFFTIYRIPGTNSNPASKTP